MSKLFPTYPIGMIRPVKGEGSWLWDEKGDAYLDFTSGIGVLQLGHGPQEVKQKVLKQMERVWHTSNLFEIEPQLQLAQKLTEISGMDRVFFANSGAEANEAAIKLARRYHQMVKKQNRYEVITFLQSFHGRTLATLTATGQDKVKEGFQPLPTGFITIPYGDIDSLKDAITSQTAAILLEVIQGEGGIHPAEEEWLVEVERIAKEQDILLIVDEVQTGIGRTGKWFGFQHYPIQPDVITIAKGLGSGFPIGAMIAKEKYKEAFSLGSHGSTFGGNFLVTTAGLATIETIENQQVIENVIVKGLYLIDQLEKEIGQYEGYKEIRGKGFMIGIEWNQPVAELLQIAKDQGILLLTAGPNVIRLLPPLNVTIGEIDQAIEKLKRSMAIWLENSKEKSNISIP
ncbi:aspartate aminotransferase family protein [Tepidibacillus marianensis]|uniref:aspartate aminotransferase family protein n=1 Tax=Tepidibacillus marianensis TaxID=3131995 RepID=UPI0030CDD9A0